MIKRTLAVLSKLQPVLQPRHNMKRLVMARNHSNAQSPTFTLVSEEIVFQRYLTLYNRKVQFPEDDKIYEFDVIGHPRAQFHFCVTFPFHPPEGNNTSWRDGSVTLIKEYAQGVHEMVYCLPTGAFDPHKHPDYASCARSELSEEAHLTCKQLTPLLQDDEQNPGIPEVKWCANRFTPYLALDLEEDAHPGQRDGEEYIEIVKVSIQELKKLMKSGRMMLPSIATCWLAFEYLDEQYSCRT